MAVTAVVTTVTNVLRLQAAGFSLEDAFFSLYGIGLLAFVIPALLSFVVRGARWLQVVAFYVAGAIAAVENHPSLQPFLWLLCSILLAWQYGYLSSRNGLRSTALIVGFFAMWGFNAVLLLLRDTWSVFPISIGGLFVFFVVWSILVMQTRVAIGRASDLEAAVKERTSELSAALHEKNQLVQELHHQSKSGLQMISSMLQFEQDELSASATQQALAQTQRRVHALARLHDRVLHATDHGAVSYKRFITEHLEDAVAACNGLIQPTIGPMSNCAMPNETALKIGIALNEILYGIVDSVEMASPGVTECSIACEASEVDAVLRVTISVNCTSAADEPLLLSTRLQTGVAIARSTVQALSGSLEHGSVPRRWQLCIPVLGLEQAQSPRRPAV